MFLSIKISNLSHDSTLPCIGINRCNYFILYIDCYSDRSYMKNMTDIRIILATAIKTAIKISISKKYLPKLKTDRQNNPVYMLFILKLSLYPYIK